MSITPEELRMYIVVNDDIKMDKSKIASQVGHAVMLVTEYLLTIEKYLYYKYKNNGMDKIILTADKETMEKLASMTEFVVYDGITLTVVAFGPMTETIRDRHYPELIFLDLL